jgi:hypothetical protein
MTDCMLGFPEYGTEIYTKLNNDPHLRTDRVCVCVLTRDRRTGADEVRVEEIPNKEGNSSNDASGV